MIDTTIQICHMHGSVETQTGSIITVCDELLRLIKITCYGAANYDNSNLRELRLTKYGRIVTNPQRGFSTIKKHTSIDKSRVFSHF